jgi:hypothetical protein
MYAIFTDYVNQGLATFAIPQTTLAFPIFVEGFRKKLIMLWTVSKTYFCTLTV